MNPPEVNRLAKRKGPARRFCEAARISGRLAASGKCAAARPMGGRGRVFSFAYYALAALLIIVAGLCAWTLAHHRRRRRHSALQDLMDQADRLETDLKDCRDRLQRAHAVMQFSPDQPAVGEVEAQQAVDSGLRALLQQRLWIRDRAPSASQRELDQAVDALVRARHQLEPRLQALDDAQTALDTAVREHFQPDR